MSMYHWEAEQEDFLVVSGEALLIAEARSDRSGSGTSVFPPRAEDTILEPQRRT